MVIVRPIALDDLDPLMALASLASFGLTTLPKDRNLLAERVEQSLEAFAKLDAKRSKPRGQTYLFVMEDLDGGRLIGTTGIVSKVGGFDPHWTYRLESELVQSEMLKISKQIQTLHLQMQHSGPCEIGSLFLHPDVRGGGRGRLLSVARFLFMAEHSAFFDPMVIAEMRGVIDQQGNSPFWEAVGRHFFEIPFPTADYLSMVDKRFIAELMPKHPIYVTLLPPAAQAVIGKVHEQTRPALAILEREGFKFSNEVDIFEAGPVVSCPLQDIRAVRQSRRVTVAAITDDALMSPPYALATTGTDFRAGMGALRLDGDERVTLPRDVAAGLGVKVDDAVRCCPLKPEDGKP